MTVYVNGSSQLTKSGSESGTVTYSVSVGDYITITYSKDGSAHSGNDIVVISNIEFAETNT